ncbi:MAG: hypothetical protein ACTSV5_13480 [Promethearchaeota archaeon]
MADSHSKSFFGQNICLIVRSSSKFDPFIYMQCIKRNPNGIWEKLSSNEGKTIKCSLEEMAIILQVINRRKFNWQGNHKFNETITKLSICWEDENAEVLWINIGNYSKMLNSGQIDILALLLTHLLSEKIIYATSYKPSHNLNTVKERFEDDFVDELRTLSHQASIKETISKSMTEINGKITGETNKAILLEIGENQKTWIPKSCIHSQYDPKPMLLQPFLVENWILKKMSNI